MIGEFSVPYATAVVGYDLATGMRWKVAAYGRMLAGLALTGSAAAGDTKISAYAGGNLLGEFYNKATGFPTRDHMIPMQAYIPPGVELQLLVDDAPGTNPINGICVLNP